MQLSVQLLDKVAGVGAAGDTVQLSLAPSDVHIAEEIDNYLAGYSPLGYRADEACPVVLVDKETDQFRTFGEANAFQRVETRTSRQGAVQEIDPSTQLDTYLVEERALGAFIPRATQSQATFDVKAASGRRIMWALGLDREIRIFGSGLGGLLVTAANWNANNVVTVGAGAAKWTALDTADPIGDLQNLMRKSAQVVTNIWMPEEVSHNFMRCVSVREHMRQMLGDGPATPAQKQTAGTHQNLDYQIPGLPPIKVAPNKVLNETTGLLDPIFANQVVLTGDPGTPTDGMSIQTCVTWRERKASGNGILTREFEVDARGLEGGEMMVSGHAEDEKMIANNVGGLLEAVLV